MGSVVQSSPTSARDRAGTRSNARAGVTRVTEASVVDRLKRRRRAIQVNLSQYVLDVLNMAGDAEQRDARGQATHVLVAWAERWAKQHPNEMQAWGEREARPEKELDCCAVRQRTSR